MTHDVRDETQPTLPEDDAAVIGGVIRIGLLGCLPVLFIIAGIIIVTSGALAAIGPAITDALFAFGGLPLVLLLVGAFMTVAAIGNQSKKRRGQTM